MRVPFTNRVGDENDGWSVAKQLMRFARGNNTTSGLLWRAHRKATKTVEREPRRKSERAQLERFAALTCELVAFEALELRTLCGGHDDGVGAVEASMLKTLATELHQRLAAFALDAAGPAAAVSGAAADPWAAAGAFAGGKYFATRAASIYSGTNETHRNLIARAMLSRS